MSDEKDIYIIMEINYLKENNRSLDDDNFDMFPNDWYSILDYQLKSEILLEAIKNNVKIIDTKKYRELYDNRN